MKPQLPIMIIDDNQATNLYHKIMIEDAGISLENLSEFTSARDAIIFLQDIIEQNSIHLLPAVILLDINMPIMNGWEFIERLKAMNLGEQTPEVYMVSNSRHPLDIAKAEQDPVIVDICEKPLPVEFFAGLIKEVALQVA